MSFNPLKRRKYGSTKAVITELFRQAGGIPEVMEILEIGRTRAYDLTDPNNETELSLDRVEKLVRESGATVIAEHFAFLSGGVFLPIETTDDDVDWHSLASRASKKNAANIGGILESINPNSEISPGYIDADEARALIKKLDNQFALLTHQRQLLAAIIEEEEGPQHSNE